jgi:hypothetical protein
MSHTFIWDDPVTKEEYVVNHNSDFSGMASVQLPPSITVTPLQDERGYRIVLPAKFLVEIAKKHVTDDIIGMLESRFG